MSSEALLGKLQTIFRETLDSPQLVLQPETTANEVAEWDSVSHLILLHAIEQEFALSFSLDEVMQFQNVGDICSSIQTKLETSN